MIQREILTRVAVQSAVFFPSVAVIIELHINSVCRLFGHTIVTVCAVSVSSLFGCNVFKFSSAQSVH